MISRLIQQKREKDGITAPTEPSFLSMGVADDQDKGKTVQESDFYQLMTHEIGKIDKFTVMKGEEFRLRVTSLFSQAEAMEKTGTDEQKHALRTHVDAVGREILRLEKYVNINYTACRKILKKHDKHLDIPMKHVFSVKLSNMDWIKGKFSDLFVTLSRTHEKLRKDTVLKQIKGDAQQSFVRKTRKFWVKTEDVTQVKCMVLRHLPIFVMSKHNVDSQLVNSVYWDNEVMELYHGRLDKTPDAIALRFRWYDTQDPTETFLERKTHRESWCGDISVKERFSLPLKRVMPFLHREYAIATRVEKMRARGTRESELEALTTLSTEILNAVESKQLVPKLRTQCMRTAFQIPFDPTVRISLDTNLCMMVEHAREGDWYRPSSDPLEPTQVTHFPHGVLEVKLQLEEGMDQPQWVDDLLNSGLVFECHKFSKYIHGCATLLREDVRAVPYWIDDLSLAQSIALPRQALTAEQAAQLMGEDLQKPLLSLPPTDPNLLLPNAPPGSTYMLRHTGGEEIYCCCFTSQPEKVLQVVEPKLFFAAERTFLHWLSLCATLATIGLVLFGFSDGSTSSMASSLSLCAVAVLLICYSFGIFVWRNGQLLTRGARCDDRLGPYLMTSGVVICLLVSGITHFQYLDFSNNNTPANTTALLSSPFPPPFHLN
eukprot:gnl/Spiro4/18016_TR9618_c0_g1_i1.p1 gnl/Spiro4/18016_TR9618_c0_g1~~gnl/Spiro4/18016_TR9618_c0_g1_i1.p1  ORF type:complete len:703 (+),score=189.83 gnl/Spiro4/18016_TR9618_c0_g1_i1:136-2109(+)